MSKYEVDFIHRPGGSHQAAHALLQLKTDGIEDRPVEDDITVLPIEKKLPVSCNETEDYFVCSTSEDYINKLPARTIALADDTTNNVIEPQTIQEFIEQQSKGRSSETAGAPISMNCSQYRTS